MGLLATVTEPLSAIEWTPLAYLGAAGTVLTAIVLLNVLKQLIFRNPTEPPLVFHLFPIIGSTITYGMQPVEFFAKNKAKVCAVKLEVDVARHTDTALVRQLLLIYSIGQKDDGVCGNEGQ
jgi:hypothetical protein